MKFEQDTPVVIRRLGRSAPGEYRAIIKGIAVKSFPNSSVYILETLDKIPGQEFSHITIVESCIDLIGLENERT